MTRTFDYVFDPPSGDPIPGPKVSLTVDEIEAAGVKEVLQTPGPAFGSWMLLDALLEPTGLHPTFVGIERRVVKAAIGDDVSAIRSVFAQRQSEGQVKGGGDAVGTWVVRLSEQHG